jgi:hypothetical protein
MTSESWGKEMDLDEEKDSPKPLANSGGGRGKDLATRSDEPVVCAKCGKKAKRRMRGQKYCSRICRERDRERCRKAFLGP